MPHKTNDEVNTYLNTVRRVEPVDQAGVAVDISVSLKRLADTAVAIHALLASQIELVREQTILMRQEVALMHREINETLNPDRG